MQIGMYTAELSRPTAAELFAAVHEHGFTQVQLDLASVCGEQMPESIDANTLDDIRLSAGRNCVEIAAVNGTFNMIHPQPSVRAEGIRRFESVARSCAPIGCELITLCTGTRSLESMWRAHPENSTGAAWADLTASMEPLLEIAERWNVSLGVECEVSNVIDSAERARKLLDELRSPRLKIIMDAANLFHAGDAHAANVRPTIKRAFDLLGDDIALAHGKDIREGDAISFAPAGQGIVDFDYFLSLLDEYRYQGGLILHGMKREEDFPPSVAFITQKLRDREARRPH